MTLRIVQVGVGGFGRAWRRGIEELSDAHVVAIVDPRRDALEEGARHFDLPASRCLRPEDPWEEIDADLVIDASPHLYHLDNARRAYPNGKSHLVVKPMADTWEAGVEMVELAEKHGVRLVVGQQLRYHPLIERLRTAVDEGAVGAPTQLLIDFVEPMEGYTHRAWRQPHPLLVESAIHQVDFVRYVLNADAESVICDTWTPNYLPQHMALSAVALYRMTDGTRVCYRGIASNDASLRAGWLGRWMLEGDQGIVRVIKDTISINGDDIALTWDDGRPASDLGLPRLNARIVYETARYIREGVEPGVSGRNNLNSLHMSMGAVQSAEQGTRVDLYRRT
ncbi:Gfo/Idh/MocA family oxidoreductase [Candidatus Poribacteria bacterium]|nr:Gfo/Idh/MocA family oxidoreductase [Candidatus Poribacteria bacterium]